MYLVKACVNVHASAHAREPPAVIHTRWQYGLPVVVDSDPLVVIINVSLSIFCLRNVLHTKLLAWRVLLLAQDIQQLKLTGNQASQLNARSPLVVQ